jgi:hypothetical protein
MLPDIIIIIIITIGMSKDWDDSIPKIIFGETPTNSRFLKYVVSSRLVGDRINVAFIEEFVLIRSLDIFVLIKVIKDSRALDEIVSMSPAPFIIQYIWKVPC